MINQGKTSRPLIFIIGPMNDKEQPEASRDHTLVIRNGIVDAVKDLLGTGAGDQLPVDVRAPIEDRGSDIPTDVFSNIDVADLLIADISLPNPPVFYELAYAHSLGVPTILVQDATKGQDAFYLKLSRYEPLTAITQDAVKTALTDCLAGWLKSRGFELKNDSETESLSASELMINPITKFYLNVPLLDISAAAGLALGYLENFIKPVMSIAAQPPAFANALTESKKAKGSLVVNAITGLVIVKPASLDSIKTHIDEALPKMLAVSKEIYGDADGAPCGKLFLDCGKAGRRTAHIIVEGVAIDIPRTLYPLRRSIRLRRLVKEQSLCRKIEEVLINRFAERIVEQAHIESDAINGDRLCIAPAGELAEAVKDLIEGRVSQFSVKNLYENPI
jgi:hypothetical protein